MRTSAATAPATVAITAPDTGGRLLTGQAARPQISAASSPMFRLRCTQPSGRADLPPKQAQRALVPFRMIAPMPTTSAMVARAAAACTSSAKSTDAAPAAMVAAAANSPAATSVSAPASPAATAGSSRAGTSAVSRRPARNDRYARRPRSLAAADAAKTKPARQSVPITSSPIAGSRVGEAARLE
jgi:hypothetical protein